MRRILFFVIFVSSFALGFAQLRQLNNTATGEGRVMVGNHTNERVSRLTLDLRRGGDFEMTLQGDSRWRIAGTWRLRGDNQCQLDIEEAIGDKNATGSGTVWLENMNQVREVSINGRAMRDNLVVTFTARGGGGGGGNWSSVDMNHARYGSGTYTMTNGRSVDINRIGVVLRRDGSATITAYGDRTYVFSGNQTNATDSVVDVSIDRVENSYDAEGRGYISRDGKTTFSRLEIAGRVGNRRYSLQFSAVGGGGGGGDNPSFNDRAKGNGNLRRDRARDTFGQVDVDCRRDGTFEMRIYADRTETISGTWRTATKNQISLEVNRAFGTSASGRGNLRLSNSKNLDRIDLAGNSGRGSYSVDFTAGDNDSGFNGINAYVDGRGWIQWPNRPDSRVTRMRVFLRSDGRAEFTPTGDNSNMVLTGEWFDFDARRHTVSIRITGGTGTGPISAAGSVTLDNANRRPQKVTLDGRTNGRNFNVTFQSN